MKAYLPLPLVLIGILTSAGAHAGWTDDWFNNAVVSGSSSYQNQQRGFYSAGGFQGRLNTAVDYPITVTLPKLKSGCGGVDLFLGGMSFLDADYLVQKFQNIIQAAPALAFDIALKVMAKELSDSMSKLEGATNWLNNLQLDDCAISNRVVTAVAEDDPDILGAVWNEITSGESLGQSINKSYDQAQQDIQANNSSPTVDLKDQISQCPADFRALFASGSIIENATTLFGIPDNADVMRGYIGDVVVRADATDFIPIATRVEACPGNDRIGIEDMLEGTAQAKLPDGTCIVDNANSIRSIVTDLLVDIANNMEAKAPLTADQVTFIENSPIPIYSILRKAISQQNVNMTIAVMTDVVATAYAHRIVDDLYRNTEYLFRKAEAIASMPGVDGAAVGNQCRIKVFDKALVEFGRMHDSVRAVRTDVSRSYVRKVQENLAHWQFAKLHEDEERVIRRKAALEATN